MHKAENSKGEIWLVLGGILKKNMFMAAIMDGVLYLVSMMG
jgi:hypothetical protein